MTRTKGRPPPSRHNVTFRWWSQLLLTITILPLKVSGHGMTTFQCPNGFYISKFNSAYDGSERLYQFGCSRFSSNIMVSFISLPYM